MSVMAAKAIQIHYKWWVTRQNLLTLPHYLPATVLYIVTDLDLQVGKQEAQIVPL